MQKKSWQKCYAKVLHGLDAAPVCIVHKFAISVTQHTKKRNGTVVNAVFGRKVTQKVVIVVIT